MWHICDTYDCDDLPQTTFRFYLIDFQLNKDFPSQISIFYCFFFLTSVTLRSGSQDNCFYKE